MTRSAKVKKKNGDKKSRRFTRFGLAVRITGGVALVIFVLLLYLFLGPPSDRLASHLLTGLKPIIVNPIRKILRSPHNLI